MFLKISCHVVVVENFASEDGRCPKKCTIVSSNSSQFRHILVGDLLMVYRCLLSPLGPEIDWRIAL